MKKRYETVFILTPVLSEAKAKETAAKYKKLLSDNDAKVHNEESWGLKKLAYPIQKKSTGFYYLFEFEATGEALEKIELAFRRDERIMRYLTVNLDKHAVAYSERRIERLKGATKA